ncbi:LacI family DNA-binding transcriptional regulator [Aggregatilinea lenta]|uniref:LacI family DNA-binding transcriptional regulator n=1 Tax=Aggregatilinea lenta TaxID=913108 RepID=UPI000E5A27F6|nr:LacI family DNA-binding transcriptional regulator [Aggregatilinea lenta]
MMPLFGPETDEQSEISIADVAKAAGVSISTVSRVLNNKPDVAKKTRVRVQRVINELGYTPYVQTVQQSKTNTISLHYPLLSQTRLEVTDIELDFILGASSAAGEENFALNLLTRDLSAPEMLDLYRTGQLRGIVLMETTLEDWRVQLLRSSDCPFVMIGRCADNKDLSYIDLDLEGAVIQAFEHLIALGHQQIGFLGFPASKHERELSSAHWLQTGYERVARQYSLPLYYRHVDFGVQYAYQAACDLLDEAPDLTAMVMAYSGTVVGLIRALQERNRSVPKDFSIVGIGPGKIANLLHPLLSSVDFPFHQVGYQAAKMLMHQIAEGTSGVQQILVPPQLVVRETSGRFQKEV